MKFASSILLAIILVFPVTAQGQEIHYRIGMPCFVPPECTSPEIEAFFCEAYRRVGAGVEFVYLPMLRDLDDTDHGVLDGSALRTEIAIRKYRHLIAVDVPLGFYSLAAFTIKPGIRIACPEDMKGLSVGIVRGTLAPALLCELHAIRT